MAVGSTALDSRAAAMLAVDTLAAGVAKQRGKICELATPYSGWPVRLILLIFLLRK
jgi:hypothetical protein